MTTNENEQIENVAATVLNAMAMEFSITKKGMIELQDRYDRAVRHIKLNDIDVLFAVKAYLAAELETKNEILSPYQRSYYKKGKKLLNRIISEKEVEKVDTYVKMMKR